MANQAVSAGGLAVQASRAKAGLYCSNSGCGVDFPLSWIAGFLMFTLFPLLASLYLSFTNFTVGETANWVGLRNYQTLFTDPVTYNALRVTLRFGLISLPVSIILPLAMATLLNSKQLAGKRIFRVLFYMPYVVPAISGAFIWQSFLNGETGIFNRMLRLIGIANPPDWLYSSQWIHPAMVLIGVWGVGNAMLTMLAGMQGVPPSCTRRQPWTARDPGHASARSPSR
jgi:multiple sugar transport system permease protein